MVMPRESFGIPNNISNNNSTSWGVLERRSSDRNYEKMTSSTKSKSKSSATNHYYDEALDDSKSSNIFDYFYSHATAIDLLSEICPRYSLLK